MAKNLECYCTPAPLHNDKGIEVNNSIDLAGLSIDLKNRSVRVADKHFVLSKTELNLLIIFLSNLEKVITIDQLNVALESKRLGKSDENPIIVNHIRRLKRKFLDVGLYCGPKSIYTKGYIWNPLITERNLTV
ncbi:response regulator transcription factor [Pedobacter sp. CCM 8938]|uniref:Response regulator transcription factor n=1 Tax=Pedobacter fastidiosus TaxID=2765361 RepID=A0ABR7KXY2_9SPHI|nr:response regulator transcription factor [Pedobacter fastidiosus]